jgi:hypothetical protein
VSRWRAGYGGSANAGGWFLPDSGRSFGNAFVAKLDTSGAIQFARAFEGTSNRQVGGVGIDSYGQVVVSINYQREMSFAGASFTTANAEDWENATFKLAAVDGKTVWSRRYFGTGTTPNLARARSLVISRSSDRIVMAGTFAKNIDFGRGTVTGDVWGNAFLTRFYQ